jgi:glycosyltransferase involved in cell wall biosynthesis
VAIATYNRAAMVRQAIEAALAQSRPPDEIVVSDDASTDETFATLEQLAARDPRVKAFRREGHCGGASNANFAIRQTRGDLIAWCSDDDRFLPDHLEASQAYLEAHPEIGMAHSGFLDAVEAGGRSELFRRPLRSATPLKVDRGGLLRYLLRYYDWPVHPSTMVLRREVWEAVGEFDERYALTDTDWFVRVAEEFPVVMLPRHGAVNRRHAGNWSNRLGSARMQREIFEIVERSISRQFRGHSLAGMFWRGLWRINVGSRLALTLQMRLRTGHAEAACAAWHGILQDTGRRTPEWMERIGAKLIRRWCGRREPSFENVRQSVSPL